MLASAQPWALVLQRNSSEPIGIESDDENARSCLSPVDSTIGRANTSLGFLEKTEINEMSETFVLIHSASHTDEDFETIANILRDGRNSKDRHLSIWQPSAGRFLHKKEPHDRSCTFLK